MAIKDTQPTRPITLEELKAKKDAKFTGVLFEHPQGYGTLEVARLTRSEREQIQKETRRADGTMDIAIQNRMAAAFGLVTPRLTAVELLEYPDDFIEPVAEKVWDISNDYRDLDGKGDGEVTAPFSKRSGFATGTPTAPGDSPAK